MTEPKKGLEYRNPVRISDGTFDVEVNHPAFGWIPFTASPNDCEPHGRVIHAHLVAEETKVTDNRSVEEARSLHCSKA